jgi:RimJ/RimL family protein N-acetyltransferase
MSDPSFHIETPRLYISHFIAENDSHCDFLVELYNTPEFIAGEGKTPITTREAARERLAGRFRDEYARGFGSYLVSLKNGGQEPFTSATPVGTVSMMKGSDPNSYVAPDLGFAMLSAHMRKGYAKEAAQGLMDWYEKEKGVKDVLGLHNPKNTASAAVFRSLGFRYCGLRQLRVFGNVIGSVWTKQGMAEDLGVYGLPSEEATLEAVT